MDRLRRLCKKCKEGVKGAALTGGLLIAGKFNKINTNYY